MLISPLGLFLGSCCTHYTLCNLPVYLIVYNWTSSHVSTWICLIHLNVLPWCAYIILCIVISILKNIPVLQYSKYHCNEHPCILINICRYSCKVLCWLFSHIVFMKFLPRGDSPHSIDERGQESLTYLAQRLTTYKWHPNWSRSMSNSRTHVFSLLSQL